MGFFDRFFKRKKKERSLLDLIDDRTANGASDFKGEHIHFLTEKFKNWDDVLNYLIPK